MKNLLANHALLPMFDFVSSSLSPRPFIKFSVSRIPSRNLSSIGSFKKLKNSLQVNPNSEKQDFFAPELQFKDVLEFDGSLGKREGDEDLVKLEDMEEEEKGVVGYRRGKQVVKRSSLMAKQVISIQSALSLGFVSQLWVDANSWMVKIVEVRPNLLSGEVERFLLEDTSQVGDVVLIPDESVMEKEFKMVGLETLVGYNVVTPGRRNIGKVRGYTFNINSGGVESLELDSFGISIIPSSFVSTYALFVEDVLEVGADTIMVHEAAASRIQRLTKGFWDGQRVDYDVDEVDEYSDMVKQHSQYGFRKDKRRRSSSQRSRRKTREDSGDWELPMDYL